MLLLYVNVIVSQYSLITVAVAAGVCLFSTFWVSPRVVVNNGVAGRLSDQDCRKTAVL